MNPGAFVAVGVGAVFGAYARWGLGAWLNPASPNLPLGTLAANAIGGYVVGIAVAWFAHQPDLPPEWRLFLVTGFLGALTTFSTYSAEAVGLLLRGQYGWAAVHVAAHLAASLALTVAGIHTYRVLAQA